jgi:hypothetical protein
MDYLTIVSLTAPIQLRIFIVSMIMNRLTAKYEKMEVQLHAFLTSALNIGTWSASRHSRFIPEKIVRGTHSIGGWVGCRAYTDAVVKRNDSCPCQESNPCRPAGNLVTILTDNEYRVKIMRSQENPEMRLHCS